MFHRRSSLLALAGCIRSVGKAFPVPTNSSPAHLHHDGTVASLFHHQATSTNYDCLMLPLCCEMRRFCTSTISESNGNEKIDDDAGYRSGADGGHPLSLRGKPLVSRHTCRQLVEAGQRYGFASQIWVSESQLNNRAHLKLKEGARPVEVAKRVSGSDEDKSKKIFYNADEIDGLREKRPTSEGTPAVGDSTGSSATGYVPRGYAGTPKITGKELFIAAAVKYRYTSEIWIPKSKIDNRHWRIKPGANPVQTADESLHYNLQDVPDAASFVDKKLRECSARESGAKKEHVSNPASSLPNPDTEVGAGDNENKKKNDPCSILGLCYPDAVSRKMRAAARKRSFVSPYWVTEREGKRCGTKVKDEESIHALTVDAGGDITVRYFNAQQFDDPTLIEKKRKTVPRPPPSAWSHPPPSAKQEMVQQQDCEKDHHEVQEL